MQKPEVLPLAGTPSLFRRWLRSESQCVQEKLLVSLPMLACPFFERLSPREFATFLALSPFVFSDFLFNQVGDPVERIRQHHWRHLNVLLGLQYLAHRLADNVFRLDIEQRDFVQVKLDSYLVPLMV